MLKIGDFSRLGQVTIQTLRHYDDLGLLKPSTVDAFTGYRYYSYEQLPRLNRILALKDLGFSLEQIAAVLNAGVSVDQLRGMLRLRQAEQQEQVRAEQARLDRVAARLRQIEREGIMSNYEVLLKNVAPQWVAGLRRIIPTYTEQRRLWDLLMPQLAQHGARQTGPCLTLYYDPGYKESEVDLEVCQPVAGPLAEGAALTAGVRVYELPGAASMASTLHHGQFDTISEAYDALLHWISANGYQVAGPAREVVLSMPPAGEGAPLIEVQFPVVRA